MKKNLLLLLVSLFSVALNAQQVNVEFQVDMTKEYHQSDSVFVRGSWDNWATPVALSSSGTIFTGTIQLNPGDTIEYKFINRSEYEDFTGDCTTGMYNNRILVVPNTDTELPLVCFNTCNMCINWWAPQLAIRQIQGDGEETPYLDQDVKAEGEITAINQYGVYIQDTSAARSGIWVYEPTISGQYAMGDNLHVIGTVEEYNGETSISDIHFFMTAPENYAIEATPIDLWQVNEDYEGVLISVSDVEVVGIDQYNKFLIVNQQNDTVIIDNMFYTPPLEIGHRYNLSGVVRYRFESHRICLRNEADIERLTVNVTFSVDMQNESVSNDSVFIRGDWSDWQKSILLSADNSVYSTTIPILIGATHQYKFLNGVNGWEEIPGGTCNAPGNDNRIVTVANNDTILSTVCFGECLQCMPFTTIQAIQGTGENTPYEGQLVKTKGRILAINEHGAFIQDTTWERSGIWIYDITMVNTFQRGNHIELTATATEYNGLTELKDIVQIEFSSQTYFPVFTSNIQASQIGEDYESVYVGLENMQIIELDQYNQYVVVSEQNDTVIIDNFLYQPTMTVGARYNIKGIVHYRYNSFRVCPRDQNEIVQLPDLIDVTFQVDMTKEDHQSDSVFVRGSWDNWATPVALSSSGTIFTGTVEMNEGDTIEYKFINRSEYEDFTGDCTTGMYNNRLLVVPNTDTELPLVCFNTCNMCINWWAPQLAIRQIQGDGEETPYLDQDVKAEGEITAINQYGVYIQDTSAARSGIWVYEPTISGQYAMGDNLHVIGTVEEYNGETSISDIHFFMTAPENYAIEATPIDLWQVNEDYEGVLISVSDVEVVGIDQYNKFLIVNQQNDTVIIDNSFYTPPLEIGHRYNLSGVVRYRFESHRICLRNEADIERLTSNVTFSVDMQNESVSNDSVFIRGDWSNWQKPILLSANNSVYSTTIPLLIGATHQYKFLNGVNGWEEIPGGICNAPGNDNRIVTVADNDTILSAVCFGECLQCMPFTAIQDIQGTGDNTPYEGQLIKTKGRILAINEFGAFIQDTTWERSGIWIYDTTMVNTFHRGNHIELTAMAAEYNGLTELKDIVQIEFSSQTYFPVFTSNIQASQIGEDYESVYVGLENMRVLELDQYNQYVVVSEQNDTVIIDNFLYQPAMTVGARYNIRGIVHYRYNSFRVCPRDANGIQLNPAQVQVTFNVNMENIPTADSVFVQGSWNNWQEPHLLSQSGDLYSVQLEMDELTDFQYRFINGNSWEIFEGSCVDSASHNRMFTTSVADTILPAVCFASCNNCVEPDWVTIREIQGEGNETPLFNQLTKTQGIITATNAYGGFIQDSSGVRSGVFIFDNSLAQNFSAGDAIEIKAVPDEYNGLTELQAVVSIEAATQSNFPVMAESIQANQIGEDYESVLVDIENLHITGQDQWGNYLAASEAGDTVVMDNFLTSLNLDIGGHYNVRGIVHYRHNMFKLSPRDQSELIRLPDPVDVTFVVDMTNREIDATGVFVQGDWNQWNEPIPLTANGNLYSTTITLEADSAYQYKFKNGLTWEDIPDDCTVGEYNNRHFTAPSENDTLPTVCFNNCSACADIHVITSDVQPANAGNVIGAGTYFEGEQITLEAEANANFLFSHWSVNGQQVSTEINYSFEVIEDATVVANFITAVDVTFRVDLQNELVSDSGVYINGSWGNWNLPTKMSLETEHIYSVTLSLPTNSSHEYKFVNGPKFAWDLYEIPSGENIEPVYGNRLLSVETSAFTVPLVCYNSSVACNYNEPPMAFAQTVSVEEDSVVTIILQALDNEDAADQLTFNIESQPANVSEFTQNGNSITYRPQANFYGSDAFDFTVTDTENATSQAATVTINISAVNDQPTVQAFSIDANLESEISIDISPYVSDLETAPNALQTTFVPSGSSVLDGSVSQSSALKFVFTANNPAGGEDYIVYKIFDGELWSFSELITVTNLPSNKSQMLGAASASVLTTNDEIDLNFGQSMTLEFLGIDKTTPYEQLQITVVEQPKHGTFENFSSLPYGGSVLTSYTGNYTSTENSNVTDSIVFAVSNGTETVQGTYYINISAVQMPPQLGDVAAQQINENENLVVNLSVEDSDTDLADLSWTTRATPNIDLTINVEIINNIPVATYSLPAEFTGNVMVKTVVSDPDNLKDSTLFNLNVINSNDAPVILFDNVISANEDETLQYTLRVEDYDKDSIYFEIAGLPEWLTAERSSKYTFDLIGQPDYTHIGTTPLSISVTDNTDTISSSVSLEVAAVNDTVTLLKPFAILKVPQGTDSIVYNLNEYFFDEDAIDPISFSISENTDTLVAYTTIKDSILHLDFMYGKLDTTWITIAGASQGDTTQTQLMAITKGGSGNGSVNTVPYANFTSDTTAFEDAEFNFEVSGIDDDGDEVFLIIDNLPQWISAINEANETVYLQGTPLNEDVGNYAVTIGITDKKDTSWTTLAVEVLNTDDLPYLTSEFDTLLLTTGTMNNLTYDLANYFADDDVSDTLQFEVTSNTNPEVAVTSISSGVLQLQVESNEKDTIQVEVSASASGESISTKMVIILDFKVGVNHLDDLTEFKTYPNPVTDKLTVKFYDGSAKWNLKIVSMNGRLIHEAQQIQMDELEVPASIFNASGVYFIHIKSEKQSRIAKVVVK